ncbi:hypothetical protein ACE6H2_007618 [Prunus campanulata]
MVQVKEFDGNLKEEGLVSLSPSVSGSTCDNAVLNLASLQGSTASSHTPTNPVTLTINKATQSTTAAAKTIIYSLSFPSLSNHPNHHSESNTTLTTNLEPIVLAFDPDELLEMDGSSGA